MLLRYYPARNFNGFLRWYKEMISYISHVIKTNRYENICKMVYLLSNHFTTNVHIRYTNNGGVLPVGMDRGKKR